MLNGGQDACRCLKTRMVTGRLLFCVVLACGPAAAPGQGPTAPVKPPVPRPDILSLDARTSGSDTPATSSAPAEAAIIQRQTPVTSPAPGEARALERGRGAASSPELWRGMWPLVVVLVIMAVAGLVFRKALAGRRITGTGGAIQVLSRAPIAGNQQLVLVRLGRVLVLVGVSAGKVSPVCTISDPEQVAQILGDVEGARTGSLPRAFAAAIEEQAAGYEDQAEPAGEAGGPVSGLLSKVRKLTRG